MAAAASKPKKKSGVPAPSLPSHIGNDASGFDPEDPTTWNNTADSIWKYLDSLSKSDPAAYKSFISQQKKEAKDAGFALPTGAGGGAGGAGDVSDDDSEDETDIAADLKDDTDPAVPDYFVPAPAFVISSRIVSAAVASEMPAGSAQHSMTGARPVANDVLFVNICGSPLMIAPKRKLPPPDSSSPPPPPAPIRSVAELDAAVASAAILMPLSVGKLFRSVYEKRSCFGVDVAFSDMITSRCPFNPTLQFWAIELALQHVESDHKLKVARGAGAVRFEAKIAYQPMLIGLELGAAKSLPPTAAAGSAPAAPVAVATPGSDGRPVPQLTEAGIKRIQRKREIQKRLRERFERRQTKKQNKQKQKSDAAAAGAAASANGDAKSQSKSRDILLPTSIGGGGSGAGGGGAGITRLGEMAAPAAGSAGADEPMFELRTAKPPKKAGAKSLVTEIDPSAPHASAATAPAPAPAPKPKPGGREIKLKPTPSADGSDGTGDAAPLLQLTQTKIIRTPNAAAAARATATAAASPVAPVYAIEIDHKLNELSVTFELPAAERASEVDIDLAAQTLKLSGTKYQIEISLPVRVDETRSRAAFVKKKHKLKLTAPIIIA